jgi:hypothetical protein
VTNINLLHVSAPECHPPGAFQIKVIQVQNANRIPLTRNSPLGWYPGGETCRILIFVTHFILLSAFLGWCTNYKSTHGTTTQNSQILNPEGVWGHRDSTPCVPSPCPRWSWQHKIDVPCEPHVLAYSWCSLACRNVIIAKFNMLCFELTIVKWLSIVNW